AGRVYRTGVFISVALLLWCYLLLFDLFFGGGGRVDTFAACVLSRGCCPSPTCEVSEVVCWLRVTKQENTPGRPRILPQGVLFVENIPHCLYECPRGVPLP
ncbi:unnamed protein product, partial [Ectocarpus sp. 13 AM-2016]